jgi:hypothetical protein
MNLSYMQFLSPKLALVAGKLSAQGGCTRASILRPTGHASRQGNTRAASRM